MKFDFPYHSVHEYLDEVLHPNASDQEVKVAKEAYKRLYNTALKKSRRSILKHITLALSKAEFQRLKTISQNQEMSIYDYMRQSSLTTNPLLIPKNKQLQIEQGLMELWDILEESQETNEYPMERINQKMETIE